MDDRAFLVIGDLARLVVRAFYEAPEIVVMDLLVREKRPLTDDEVASRLGFRMKDARAALGTLHADQLIGMSQPKKEDKLKNELLENPIDDPLGPSALNNNQQSTTTARKEKIWERKSSYFIHLRHFVNVVNYRISRMGDKFAQKNQGNSEFECSKCHRKWDALKHMTDLAKVNFHCPFDPDVELTQIQQQRQDLHEKQIKLQEQLKPIKDQLQKALSIELPAIVETEKRQSSAPIQQKRTHEGEIKQRTGFTVHVASEFDQPAGIGMPTGVTSEVKKKAAVPWLEKKDAIISNPLLAQKQQLLQPPEKKQKTETIEEKNAFDDSENEEDEEMSESENQTNTTTTSANTQEQEFVSVNDYYGDFIKEQKQQTSFNPTMPSNAGISISFPGGQQSTQAAPSQPQGITFSFGGKTKLLSQITEEDQRTMSTEEFDAFNALYNSLYGDI